MGKNDMGSQHGSGKPGCSEDAGNVYRFLFENAQDPIFIVKMGGDIIDANQAAVTEYGYLKEDLLRMNVSDMRVPSERSKLPGDLDKCFNEGYIFETVHLRRDGSSFPVEISSKGVTLGNEKVLFAIVRGIARRKRMEEALKFERSQLLSIFDSIEESVYISDPATYEILYANRAMQEKFGKRLIGGTCYREFQGRDAPCEFCTNRIILEREGAPYRWEYHNPTVDLDFLIVDRIIRWPDGRDVRFELAMDITERKRAEEKLRYSEASLARAQQIARLGNWEWDIVNDIEYRSEELLRIYDYGSETGTVADFINAVHPDDREFVRSSISAAVSNLKPYDIEFRMVWDDNSIRHMHAVAEIYYDEKGRAVKMFGIAQDITERKQAEEELAEAKAQAELYLDLMGHDINNMHQIALGYLELEKERQACGEGSEFIDKPVEVLKRSARLIQNVRKLQKLHSGGFRPETIDVCPMLRDVREEFGNVPGKKITLDMNGHERCPVQANELLHDVFSNLVSNAIKHTGDCADIIVDLEIREDEGRPVCLVTVEDNGPGIPDAFKDKIFNRMLKGTDKAKGMGLGLYLVKTLVDSYGGRVWVEDRIPGDHAKGARFAVMLPASG